MNFKYNSFSIRMGKIIVRLMTITMLIFFPSTVYRILTEASSYQEGLWELLWFILAIVYGIGLMVIVVDINPSVIVSDAGIAIEGAWTKYNLVWREIDLIIPRRIAFSKMWFVGSRKLTFHHLLVGVIFGRKKMPGFFVDRRGKGDELIKLLKGKMKENYKTSH